jgi:pimeloyl-ACP methyl ester carboxylesterase
MWKFSVLVDAAGFANDTPPGKVPLAFKILRYPIGRTILSKIDNRPLIEPGAKLITYPKVGHLPQIEIPQRSAADVAAFLKAR